MDVCGIDYVQTVRPSFHPGRHRLRWRWARGKLGVVGEIHPMFAASYGITERAYMFELDFSELLSL